MITSSISDRPDPHSAPYDEGTSNVCIENISPVERRKRLAGGAVGFALGLAALGALMALGVDRAWRLALMPLFLSAAVGYFQWRDKT